MTQMPPPAQYPMPQQPKTNGWAIGSLVCGILGCFPVGLTSLAAVILGFVGLGKARQPDTGGKGLAVAGLILGFLGIAWTIGVIGFSVWGYKKAQEMVLIPTQTTSQQFLTSLAAGDINTAKSLTTGDMTDTELSTLSEKLKDAGKFQNLSLSSFNVDKSSGSQLNSTVGGTAVFDSGTKPFKATFVGDANNPGNFKIVDFKLE